MGDVGSRIKDIRDAYGCTQKEFAERMLISQPYLSYLENGTKEPTKRFIRLFCLEFKVNEKWILEGEGKVFTE